MQISVTVQTRRPADDQKYEVCKGLTRTGLKYICSPSDFLAKSNIGSEFILFFLMTNLSSVYLAQVFFLCKAKRNTYQMFFKATPVSVEFFCCYFNVVCFYFLLPFQKCNYMQGQAEKGKIKF